MSEAALFRSAHAALTFAYAIQHYAIVKVSALMREMRGQVAERPHDALTAHEWHAQGAMIRAYIERMPRPEGDFLVACYSWGPARRDAMVRIVDYAIPLVGAGIVKRHLIRELVWRYVSFGRDGCKSLRQIARDLGVPRSSAQHYEAKVRAVMGGIRARAESHVEDHFRHCGLIEP
jgi:hypothetical protein